jgi:hypothetical protein
MNLKMNIDKYIPAIIISFLLIVGISVGGFYLYKNNKDNKYCRLLRKAKSVPARYGCTQSVSKKDKNLIAVSFKGPDPIDPRRHPDFALFYVDLKTGEVSGGWAD